MKGCGLRRYHRRFVRSHRLYWRYIPEDRTTPRDRHDNLPLAQGARGTVREPQRAPLIASAEQRADGTGGEWRGGGGGGGSGPLKYLLHRPQSPTPLFYTDLRSRNCKHVPRSIPQSGVYKQPAALDRKISLEMWRTQRTLDRVTLLRTSWDQTSQILNTISASLLCDFARKVMCVF